MGFAVRVPQIQGLDQKIFETNTSLDLVSFNIKRIIEYCEPYPWNNPSMLPNVFDIDVLYRICFAVLTINVLIIFFSLSLSISLHPRLQRRSRWTWKARSSPMESWTVWAQPAPATWTTTAACRAWPATRATPPAVSNLPSPPRPIHHQHHHHVLPCQTHLPSHPFIHPAMPMYVHPVTSDGGHGPT